MPMRVLGVVLALVVLVASAPASSGARLSAGSACQTRSRVRRLRISASERRAITRRHTRASAADLRRWLAQTPPPLVLRVAGSIEPFRMIPTSDEGVFDDAALATAQQALACRTDGTTHPIQPRLLTLVYAAVRHFRVPYVNVVSGYRSGNPSSRHGQGRAIDFALPGITDTRLAAWLRQQGFVGVGIYPTSGFVHLDVRGRSFFWRDTSAPSERGRERRILSALGPRYDRQARERGVEPLPDVVECEVEGEGEVEGAVDVEVDGGTAPLDGGVP